MYAALYRLQTAMLAKICEKLRSFSVVSCIPGDHPLGASSHVRDNLKPQVLKIRFNGIFLALDLLFNRLQDKVHRMAATHAAFDDLNRALLWQIGFTDPSTYAQGSNERPNLFIRKTQVCCNF